MKKFIPLFVAFIFDWIAFALLIAAFVGHFWLKIKSSADDYGLWEACSGETKDCYKWFENAQDVFQYKMTSKHRTFSNILVCFIFEIIFPTFLRRVFCIPSLAMYLLAPHSYINLLSFGEHYIFEKKLDYLHSKRYYFNYWM